MSTAPSTPAAGGVATPPARPGGVKETTRPECTHWIGAEDRYCRAVDGVRAYLTGPRCPDHTPAALQGKPEPQPGPGWPIHRQETT